VDASSINININHLARLLEMGVATGVVSLTLTRSRPLRFIRVGIRSLSEWWGELVSCPYCMSHWIAAGLVAWGRGSPRYWHWAGAYPATLEWLLVVAIAAPVAAAVYNSITSILPTHSESAQESEEEFLKAA
jgi:Protein of unknown function (DUF1360)